MELSPEWVTGFTDGEGTFYVGINKNSTMTAGYQVLPEFRIVQHKKDIQLLHAIKHYFGAGTVRVNHDDRYELRIRALGHLRETVIPHFNRYPLQTQKKFDFIKFNTIVDLMNRQEHLHADGLVRIIEIAARMNRINKYKALQVQRELLGQDKVRA